MPALPSKGKSRDLSFAALIPVSAGGVVKRLGSPDEEQHALLLFLSDSGNGGRAGSLGARLPGLPGRPLRELELGNTTA